MRAAHGDLGQFIAATVLEYGGCRPHGQTNGIARIDCSWRYQRVKEEVDCMVIELKSYRYFSDLAILLETAFGKAETNPYVVGVGSSGWSQYGVYSPSQIGVRIQFGHNGSSTYCQIFRENR